MDLPEIGLVAITYFPPGADGRLREEGFRQSLRSWSRFLDYDGEIVLYHANDGPACQEYGEWGQRSVSLGHERAGAGASLNQGFRAALEHSPLVANIDDDQMLTASFDLTPWARMLLDDEAIGAVHLMEPYPGCTGTIEPRQHGWVVRMNRHNLVAGLRACLYHRRWFEAYGCFEENISAWESERIYNEHFCQSTGPESVLALPLPWKPGIGSVVRLGQINPVTGI